MVTTQMIKPEHGRNTYQDFPQLREICDADCLTVKFREVLSAAGNGTFSVKKARVREIRQEAKGGGCKLTLSLRIESTGGQREEILYFGWLPRVWEERHQVLARFDPKAMVPPVWGPPQIIIPEWELILWAFPNDPDLPGLPFLADNAAVFEHICASPQRFGCAVPPRRVSGKIIKYAPHKRAIFRFRMLREESPAEMNIFAKAYAGRRAEAAFQIMQHLWESPQQQQGAFIMPQPLFLDRELRIIWQRELGGQSLSKAFSQISNWPGIAAEIGWRLAALHSVPAELPVELGLSQQCRKIEKYAKNMRRAFPQFRQITGELVECLLTKARELDREQIVPVHGSFKFGHIFLHDDGIGFIDFDGVCKGHPGEDLGRFAAYIHQMVLEEKLTRHTAEQIITNFAASYNHHAQRALPQAHFEWYTASHLLVSHLHKSVKRSALVQIEQLFSLAMALCRGSGA